jgi:putative endonuclease
MNYLCVYILECADRSFYTGVTNNLERRILEHQSGQNRQSYTFSRRPVILKWYSEDMGPNQAIELEKQIKKWSRIKKEALINGKFELLKQFAECKNLSSHKLYTNKKSSSIKNSSDTK